MDEHLQRTIARHIHSQVCASSIHTTRDPPSERPAQSSAMVHALSLRPLLLLPGTLLAILAYCYEAIARCMRRRVSPPKRVAVIGGGIAGFGAAHALASSGIEVDLFEACEQPGGNAKTHEWGDGVVTGLSVLAWPPEYFRNYAALLRQLQLPTMKVDLSFYLRRPDGASFVHGRRSELGDRYEKDLMRWARLVSRVRGCNRLFADSSAKSLYHFSLCNPMNFLSLRFLCRLHGISSGFWDDVITPLHCTTFLTTDLTSIPALVVPTIDDLIPLDGTPQLTSWVGSSRSVFEGITAAGGPRLRVHCGEHVETVRQDSHSRWSVKAQSADGFESMHFGFDRVVFASNAPHAASALPSAFDASSSSKAAGFSPSSWLWWGARLLLSSAVYSDEDCPMFRAGVIHSDPTVLPPDAREEVTARCCNYIEAYQPAAGGRGALEWENTFVLSSWYPSVTASSVQAQSPEPESVRASRRGKLRRSRSPPVRRPVVSNAARAPAKGGGAEGDGRHRFVSYGLRNADRISAKEGEVLNRTNHPALSPSFLAMTMLLRLCQGQQGIFFCGNMATPGNGHDLSLCSGLAVAAAMGARYPFEDAEAAADLARLRKILGI